MKVKLGDHQKKYDIFTNKNNIFLQIQRIHKYNGGNLLNNSINELRTNLPREFDYFLHGYEIDLAADGDSADYFASVSRIGPHAREVIEYIYKDSIIKKSMEKNSSVFLDNFLDKWLNNEELWTLAENLWLEFDMDCIDPARPAASFFAGVAIDPDFSHNPARCKRFIELINNSGIYDFGDKIISELFRHIELLHPRTPFSHIGQMSSRGESSARALAINFSRRGIIEYLEKIEWPGDLEALDSEIGRFDGLYDALSLQYEIVDRGVGEKIGVEFYALGPDIYIKQKKFLELLFQMGAANPLAARAVAEFSGYDPSSSQGFEIDGRRFEAYGLKRAIHHFKLTFGGGINKWKAYLAAEYDWK